MALTPIARRSIADDVFDQIAGDVLQGEVAPGEALPSERRLAEVLGVSRPSVREALKRLETDHLVVSYPRRGTFATVVDITELAAISEIRELLEPLAARRAAENASPQLRAEIREKAEEISQLDERAGSQTELMRLDLSVH